MIADPRNWRTVCRKALFKLATADSDLFESEVSVEANRVEVEGEISRLAIGTWFLDIFYRFCKTHGDISIDTSELDSDPIISEVTFVRYRVCRCVPCR
jgi:hypothetical protein